MKPTCMPNPGRCSIAIHFRRTDNAKMRFPIKFAALFVLMASTAMAQTTMPSQPQVIHLWPNGGSARL